VAGFLIFTMRTEIKILKAIIEEDYKYMLEHFPEGTTHRSAHFTKPDDFESDGDWEELVRYIYPARDKLIEKCMIKVIGMLESKEKEFKQNIIEAYRDGRTDQQSLKTQYGFYNRTADDYFNEKFKDKYD
jgi:hypothetical protein